MKIKEVIDILETCFDNLNEMSEEQAYGAVCLLNAVTKEVEKKKNEDIRQIEEDLKSAILYDFFDENEIDYHMTAFMLYEKGYRKDCSV